MQCPLSSVQVNIREVSPEGIRGLWRKGFVKEMSFMSGVKDRGSDRWWERRWWVWWGDMRRMRWTRRRVNTMRLTEWRRELIPQVRCMQIYESGWWFVMRNIQMDELGWQQMRSGFGWDEWVIKSHYTMEAGSSWLMATVLISCGVVRRQALHCQ